MVAPHSVVVTTVESITVQGRSAVPVIGFILVTALETTAGVQVVVLTVVWLPTPAKPAQTLTVTSVPPIPIVVWVMTARSVATKAPVMTSRSM